MHLIGLIVLVADTSTWSKKLKDLVSAEQVAVTSYDLHLGYDYWNYCMCVNAKFCPSVINLRIK